jgi:hypothetical protein
VLVSGLLARFWIMIRMPSEVFVHTDDGYRDFAAGDGFDVMCWQGYRLLRVSVNCY